MRSQPAMQKLQIKLIPSALRQQHIEIGARLAAEILRRDGPGNSPALIRPSSFSMARNSHSALSFDDAPNSASLSVMMRWFAFSAQRAPSPLSGIGSLAQQRNHAQFLHQRRVEGNLVEAVQNIARRSWRRPALSWIDLDKDGIMRVALANQRRDGRIAGEAAVPIGFAVDLDRPKHAWEGRPRPAARPE